MSSPASDPLPSPTRWRMPPAAWALVVGMFCYAWVAPLADTLWPEVVRHPDDVLTSEEAMHGLMAVAALVAVSAWCGWLSATRREGARVGAQVGAMTAAVAGTMAVSGPLATWAQLPFLNTLLYPFPLPEAEGDLPGLVQSFGMMHAAAWSMLLPPMGMVALAGVGALLGAPLATALAGHGPGHGATDSRTEAVVSLTAAPLAILATAPFAAPALFYAGPLVGSLLMDAEERQAYPEFYDFMLHHALIALLLSLACLTLSLYAAYRVVRGAALLRALLPARFGPAQAMWAGLVLGCWYRFASWIQLGWQKNAGIGTGEEDGDLFVYLLEFIQWSAIACGLLLLGLLTIGWLRGPRPATLRPLGTAYVNAMAQVGIAAIAILGPAMSGSLGATLGTMSLIGPIIRHTPFDAPPLAFLRSFSIEMRQALNLTFAVFGAHLDTVALLVCLALAWRGSLALLQRLRPGPT